jgi:uncharacterized protein YjiS (DUF1127 family)
MEIDSPQSLCEIRGIRRLPRRRRSRRRMTTRLFALLTRLRLALTAELQVRRDIAELAAMDDRMLCDIGTVRSEIESAVRSRPQTSSRRLNRFPATSWSISSRCCRRFPHIAFLATRADLVNYRTMLVDARDRMAKLIADGKSEADVIAARPFADYDGKLGVTGDASQNFIRVVYHSLKP